MGSVPGTKRGFGRSGQLDLRIHAVHRADSDLAVWLDGEAESQRREPHPAEVVFHAFRKRSSLAKCCADVLIEVGGLLGEGQP